jgi:hypothetical protein
MVPIVHRDRELDETFATIDPTYPAMIRVGSIGGQPRDRSV